MDCKEKLLTVKTPESQLDQPAKENSHPSPDSSVFSQITDQNCSPAVANCGDSKGMSNLFYLLKNVLVEKRCNAKRFSTFVEKQASLQVNLFSGPDF